MKDTYMLHYMRIKLAPRPGPILHANGYSHELQGGNRDLQTGSETELVKWEKTWMKHAVTFVTLQYKPS